MLQIDPNLKKMLPELGTLAPQLPGEGPRTGSVLPLMRRQQLVDLAMAYGLEENVNRDGTKAEILPVLLAAEQGGAFRKQAKRPWYLVKAAYTPDQIAQMRLEGKTLPAEGELPERFDGKLAAEEEPLDPDSFKGMQQRLKQAGIKCFGWTKEQMQEALALLAVGLPVPDRPAAKEG